MEFGASSSFKGKRSGGSGSLRDKKKKMFKKKSGFRKKRPAADLTFNYKDISSLTMFLTEEGKIVPARVSGLNAQQQRGLTQAVKLARDLAFLNPKSRTFIQ